MAACVCSVERHSPCDGFRVSSRRNLAFRCSPCRRRYEAFDRFAWDQGGYNSPKVSVYVTLEGVGSAKDRVSCSFTPRGFDLR